MYVKPEYQENGIGKLLLEHAIGEEKNGDTWLPKREWSEINQSVTISSLDLPRTI